MCITKCFEFIKNKSNKRFIPDFIFELSNRQIGIFLRWLYTADGCVFGNGERGKNSISFSSTSIKLIRDIQQLLLRFNISSRILNCKSTYNLVIRKYEDFPKFKEFIGFEIKKKQDYLNKLVEISYQKKKKRRKLDYEKITSIEYKSDLQDVNDI